MKKLVLSALFLSSFSVFAEPTIIIGEDTRVQITDAKANDVHNSIGLLVLTFEKTRGYCTGTVVGTRSVVTAAHCLYDSKTGTMAKQVSFIPGLRKSVSLGKYPNGSFNATKLRILAEYKKDLSQSYDLGLVTFGENLPAKALSIKAASNSDKKIVIAGYPGDKTMGELWEGTGERSPSFFTSSPDSYNVDTYSGQSGSVIRARNARSDTVIGIHSGAREGFFSYYNVGFLFQKATVDAVKRWIEEDK